MGENKIMQNIDALCEMQGKKKGDLDEYLGHSKGYLSSKKAEDLTWEQMCNISMFFGKTIESLVTWDFSRDAEIDRLQVRKEKIKLELNIIDSRLRELGVEVNG